MQDVFRKNYGNLTDEQKAVGAAIKEKADELLALYVDYMERFESALDVEAFMARRSMSESEKAHDDSRILHSGEVERCCRSAVAHLEESVMWACKGVYTEIPVK